MNSPELTSLAEQDSEIRQALLAGDPHGVYKAVQSAKARVKTGVSESLLQEVLARRRDFAKPVSKAPVLRRINGVGTTMLGKTLVAADGSYVKTLFFTFLFVPVIPISEYVVTDMKGGWVFQSKIPLRPAFVWWQRLALVAVALCALAAAWLVYDQSTHNDVHVTNALPKPVVARIGDRRITVDPDAFVPVSLPLGTHHVSIEGIEEGDIEVTKADAIVWNVLGASPVRRYEMVYATDDAPTEDGSAPVFYCGERLITLNDVDYVFTEPPTTLSLAKGKKKTSKWALELAPGGAATCVYRMLDDNKDALALAKQVLSDANAADVLAAFADAERLEDALALATQLVADDKKEHHLLYQNALVDAGLQDRALSEYRQRFAKQPDSAEAAVLLMHVGDRQRLPELVKRFPDEPDLLRLHIFTGGNRDTTLLERYFGLAPEEERAEVALMFARASDTADTAHKLLLALAPSADAAFARAMAGLEPGPLDSLSDEDKKVLAFQQEALRNPKKAIEMVSETLPLAALSPTTQTLLYLESARLGAPIDAPEADTDELAERFVRARALKGKARELALNKLRDAHDVPCEVRAAMAHWPNDD